MARAVALLIALAACEAKPPTCSQVSTHVIGLFQPVDRYAQDVGAAFLGRCVIDEWPAEVRRCILATTSIEAPKNCRAKLTAAQQAALDADLDAAEQKDQWRTIPQACLDYEVQLARASLCEAIPKAERDRLQQRLAESKEQWKTMDDKRSLIQTCRGAIEALKQVTAACR